MNLDFLSQKHSQAECISWHASTVLTVSSLQIYWKPIPFHHPYCISWSNSWTTISFNVWNVYDVVQVKLLTVFFSSAIQIKLEMLLVKLILYIRKLSQLYYSFIALIIKKLCSFKLRWEKLLYLLNYCSLVK